MFSITLYYLIMYLLLKCLITKQEIERDLPTINNYFHLVSNIDKPLLLRKYYGMNESSIDYYPGTMNVILSVPHDGDRQSNLPKRPKGACRKLNTTSKKCYYQNPCVSSKYKMDTKICSISHGRDKNTRLLALALRYELSQYFRLTPYVIINRLERSKVDMNRFIDEGTFGSINSMHAWIRYHFYLRHARELVINNKLNYAGKGLLLDIHSHDHEQGWTELGYMLSSRQLSNNNFNLKSSSFALHFSSLFNPVEIITGNKSLGYFITKYNYTATPSPTYPSPPEQSYFEWGYTIEEYGRYLNFSAIMIESPANEITNLTRLYIYAKALASALRDYLIELELIEALITSDMNNETHIDKKCNSAKQLNSQMTFVLLLFVNVLNFI